MPCRGIFRYTDSCAGVFVHAVITGDIHILTGAANSNAYSNNLPMIKQLKCATPIMR